MVWEEKEKETETSGLFLFLCLVRTNCNATERLMIGGYFLNSISFAPIDLQDKLKKQKAYK